MNYINVGKIVNTHGIKGELRILSKFRHKDKVFIKGNTLYIGKKKEKFIINSYRYHKIFDMVTFEGFTNINEVLKYKGDYVYINEDDLVLENEILSSKLIGYDCFIGEKYVGKIEEVLNEPASDVLRVGKILIPYVKEFIVKIENDTVYIKDIRGLM
jgi:16S rRNA processing protein RimM